MNIEKFVHNVASQYKWRVQPNQEFLRLILEGLQRKFEALGYFLCPCREAWEVRNKDRDIICPCIYASDDIAEFGQCYCGLFLSKERDHSACEPHSIPDRRPEHLYPD